jgi:ubiquinone/menaquinone biosynthesis C-methylase UbiE
MSDPPVNLWSNELHAVQYLDRADTIPHRSEGEAALLEWLPRPLARVLDLGTGDGRLLSIVAAVCAPKEAVALDFSETMIEQLRRRFVDVPGIRIVAHDLDCPLPSDVGIFDAIVSSFAIHHLSHPRKRVLYEEVYTHLGPAGSSAIWNTWPRRRRRCTVSSWLRSTSVPKMKTPRTNSSTFKRSSIGGMKLVSLTWTAIGNGESWRSWLGLGPERATWT